MDKHQKKQLKRYITFGLLVLLVVLLAAMPLLAGKKAEADGPQASILTTRPEQRTIDTQIIGGGLLTSDNTEEVTIPEAIKLTKYLVGNGDSVKKGDPIARVDKVSVMLALSEVQETLDYLAGQIASAANQKESDKITAQTAGTVKIVYGKAGDSVRDVMLEHGSLAVLSLDDKMAVDIECEADLTYGKSVRVTLANGKQVTGTVESNIAGLLTVTIADKSYNVGDTVTVNTGDGKELGSSELYIHNPWNAAAYYGTIKQVHIKPGDKVSSGKQLFQLNVGDHSVNFQILNTQRQEYEELMQELFAMYNTGVLTAPCDGLITGVDKDGTFLLAASSEEQTWFFQPLSGNADSGWKVMLLSNEGIEGGNPEGGNPEGGNPEGGNPEGGNPEGGNPEGGNPEGSGTEGGGTEGGGTEGGGENNCTCPNGTHDPSNTNCPIYEAPKNDTIYYKVTNVDATGVTLQKLNSEETTAIPGITTYADGSTIAVGDIVTLVNNAIQKVSGSSAPGTQIPNMGGMGMGGMGGFGGGGGGYSATPAFEPYSLETVTVASITSQERLTLEISVDEQDITKLRTGMDATVTVEALTGQRFPASITSISNTGTNEGGSSKFTVKLTLSKSGEMLPGMHASAYLPLQSQTAIAIPVAALVEEGTKTLVYTGYDEKKEVLINPVTVTTGVSDGEYVQILSGLTESDTVWYAYYDTQEESRIPDLGLGF